MLVLIVFEFLKSFSNLRGEQITNFLESSDLLKHLHEDLKYQIQVNRTPFIIKRSMIIFDGIIKKEQFFGRNFCQI